MNFRPKIIQLECNIYHQQRDDVDYIADEYEMKELDDFIDEFQGKDLGGFDSDVDEL